jgi:aspartate aminotransferase
MEAEDFLNRNVRFAPSLIRELANSAFGRSDVVPFWFGESDQPTPSFIREAAVASLDAGETFYSENLGRPYLRQAIATYLTQLHRRPIPTNRVAVTASGDSALMIASQLLLAPGDRVVTVTPLWPNAVEIPKIASAQVECVSLEVQEGRWVLPLQKLLDALRPETRMLVLNSPNNPTGWTIEEREQRILLEHCRGLGIWILADDVYERLIYRLEPDPVQVERGQVERGQVGRGRDYVRSAPSFLTLTESDDRLIVVNSFSKAWAMTGWRVGWLVGPASIFADLAPLIEYNTSCVPEFTQRAATAAIEDGESYVLTQRAELAITKDALTAELRRLPGVEVPEADGAMYAFLRIAGQDDSMLLARRLIDEAGLGLAPGRAFGPEGEGWLRWCYAAEWSKNQLGLERLAKFLST